MQKKLGADKVAVLLVSVDLSSGKLEKAEARARKIFEKQGLDWPNVFIPRGWEDEQCLFNACGYQKFVIDPQGKVHAINVQGKDLETVLLEALGETREK